ncbi:MAG TPA: ribonuclease HI family protein [Gallionellaceae bacterium]|nr:ribonuclease HI family protein [Gallionellaceae bacterium]
MNTTCLLPMPIHPAEPDLWQVWFDGSALPNPGKIGIGILILSPDGQRLEQATAPNLHGCNNQAELHALIAGLTLAHHSGAGRLLVRGDSDVAISHVKGTSSTQVASLTPLIAEARNWLARFEHVELQWVPRHRNAVADRLCRQALGLPPKPPRKSA